MNSTPVFVPPSAGSRDSPSFLAAVVQFPNPESGLWFDSLVGLDEVKADLLAKLRLLLSRDSVLAWSREQFGRVVPACATLLNRYPLFILEGDVGTGKTALARSIGHPLSVELGRPVELLVVNTQVRGTGLVGELTANISEAFSEAEERSRQRGCPVLLLLDEADALAQARGHAHMHHEDEAGVNTLIQRIDLLRKPGNEVIVLFATNMGAVLDAAISRRAAAIYHFTRPDDNVRRLLFSTFLEGTGQDDGQIEQLVEATAPRTRPETGAILHSFTHSDIVQRIIPQAIEQAYLRQVDASQLFPLLVSACARMLPTPLLISPTIEEV